MLRNQGSPFYSSLFALNTPFRAATSAYAESYLHTSRRDVPASLSLTIDPDQASDSSGRNSIFVLFAPFSALSELLPGHFVLYLLIFPRRYHAITARPFLTSTHTPSSQIPMFAAPKDPTPRQRSASRSTDDRSSAKTKPHRFFQRYVHSLSISSHSLATTSSHHDDLPTPSLPTHASHTTSTQSTPMTSPSTGCSSLFPGSPSSATSESIPSAESKYQSEFGCLTYGSSAYSPIHGSASSSSSHPVSPWSRSTTESDSHPSAPHLPSSHSSTHFSSRPSIPPYFPPASQAASGADNSPVDHHTRSHSRLTITIKNLLSRSAVPSPSRFSFNSTATMPSDSEPSSRSFHVPPSSKWPTTPRKSRPPDLEVSGNIAPGCTSDAPIDAHHRYTSDVAAKIHDSRTSSEPPTSQDSLHAPVRNVPLNSTCGKGAKTRNVLKRRPSSSAKHFQGRERGMSTPSCLHEGDADCPHPPSKEGMSRQGGMPFPLTAAGAVVMAYKQQELHTDDTSPSKLSVEDQMCSHDSKYDQDHFPMPYCDVFSSSSERRVQAGGSDDRLKRLGAVQSIWTTSQAGSSHQPPMFDSVGPSITRKVSSRWRKVREGGVIPKESSSRGTGHSRGLPSLQGMWGVDKSGTRLREQSIDVAPNAVGGTWASPIDGHTRSESDEVDGNDNGKLWRLIRRISTGGLRERFQSDKVVPPVPDVPKALLETVNRGEHSNEPLSPSRHQPSLPLRGKEHNQGSTTSKGIVVARPNVATPSSSPNSSDVACTQSFHQAHSTRTSMSSYGEAVVGSRMAEAVLDRHIITPLEQLRLADNHTESDDPGTSSVLMPRSPRRSTSVPAGLKTVEDAEGDRVPLPSPPRVCSGESPSSGSSRPSTSASGSESARASYQGRGLGRGEIRMEDGIVSLSPPPRPRRNSGRGLGRSMTSSPPHSVVVTQVDGGVLVRGVRQMDRVPSAQSDMTARIESPEPGRPRGQGEGDGSASPHTGTQLTFRELDAPRRPPLSEREKADIWNDLLARSDRAGGTLHINGAAELMSDGMRFSTHSEV